MNRTSTPLACLGLVLALGVPSHRLEAPAAPPVVQSLHITILSTMLADAGIGEWGFAALVEVDGRRLLFDTGARPETGLQNARELGIDLSTVVDVIISDGRDGQTVGRSGWPAASELHLARAV
jgi:hypothetical protein